MAAPVRFRPAASIAKLRVRRLRGSGGCAPRSEGTRVSALPPEPAPRSALRPAREGPVAAGITPGPLALNPSIPAASHRFARLQQAAGPLRQSGADPRQGVVAGHGNADGVAIVDIEIQRCHGSRWRGAYELDGTGRRGGGTCCGSPGAAPWCPDDRRPSPGAGHWREAERHLHRNVQGRVHPKRRKPDLTQVILSWPGRRSPLTAALPCGLQRSGVAHCLHGGSRWRTLTLLVSLRRCLRPQTPG